MFTIDLSFWQVFWIGFACGIFSVCMVVVVVAIKSAVETGRKK